MARLINMSAHELTGEQKKEAQEKYGVDMFYDFKDLSPELYKQAINSPSDEDALKKLASAITTWVVENAGGETYFHLPLGSPALNYILSGYLLNCSRDYFKLGRILFSHSERQSRETVLPDGTIKKESVFVFKKFIQF